MHVHACMVNIHKLCMHYYIGAHGMKPTMHHACMKQTQEFNVMHTYISSMLYTSIVVGLFNPLSYQDRAVQLAYNNRTNQVCFEPFKPFSTDASEVWQDGEYILQSVFVV